MAPGLIDTEHIDEGIAHVSLKAQNGQAGPTASSYTSDSALKPSGALDHLESFDITPVIGTEFPTANLVDLIQAPNADELLKELAYTSE